MAPASYSAWFIHHILDVLRMTMAQPKLDSHHRKRKVNLLERRNATISSGFYRFHIYADDLPMTALQKPAYADELAIMSEEKCEKL